VWEAKRLITQDEFQVALRHLLAIPTIERALNTVYVLEEHLRALLVARRTAAIHFAVERLRRLRPSKRAPASGPDARQLDLPHG